MSLRLLKTSSKIFTRKRHTSSLSSMMTFLLEARYCCSSLVLSLFVSCESVRKQASDTMDSLRWRLCVTKRNIIITTGTYSYETNSLEHKLTYKENVQTNKNKQHRFRGQMLKNVMYFRV